MEVLKCDRTLGKICDVKKAYWMLIVVSLLGRKIKCINASDPRDRQKKWGKGLGK